MTTVEANTTFGEPAAPHAASSARVPSTFTARILPASRCDAISAARWTTQSGAAPATAADSDDTSPVMSPNTSSVPSGAEPERRTSADT